MRSTTRRFSHFRIASLVLGVFVLGAIPGRVAAEPSPAAVSTFNAYIGSVESRLSRQHKSQSSFLVSVAAQSELRLRSGDIVVEKVESATGSGLPGAMLFHWRGTAFAPGAKTADFERLMRDFEAYPQHFYPQVIHAKTLAHKGDFFQASMRVRQRHVITVVMDTAYDIVFGRLDERNGYSISRSTRIDEIDEPGARNEHALRPGQEHGFLWRLNTYWSYEETDGGLYMQIESVSLTRSIPLGLGWAIGPFVESVPRESLEFTLRSVCNSLRK